MDRLIPADELSPGGKDCGCAVFIDRQLAGPYGRFDGYYMSGPFQKGTKEQGPQSSVTPAQQYRKALAALDAACRQKFANKAFADLSDTQKDEVIGGLEHGTFKLDGTDSQEFFKLVLKDTQNGFRPIRSTAETQTWRRGKCWDFPAPITTTANGSAGTISA